MPDITTAYIYDAIRTPRGKARDTGCLHDLTPYDLLAVLYRELQARTGLQPDDVQDVILGCVTQAGEQAANIAKTSTLYAGWPAQVPGITVNRYCSSGIDAISIAAAKIMAGVDELVVAGGVEMMSRVAMLADKPAPFMDAGLASKMGILMMGSGADLIASLYKVSREQADEIAYTSQQRAAYATEQGYFKSIIPIKNPVKDIIVKHDENIRPETTPASLAAMEPAFAALGAKGIDAAQLQAFPQLTGINHVHTAGNSPAMADAATTLLIGSEAAGRKLSCAPRAAIRDMVSVNDDKYMVVGGCVAATKAIMHNSNLSVDDIDLFEIHEAFSATVIKCKKDLSIPTEKLNVNGGCIALGHPLGATGGIMAGTLLDELERRDLKRGIVAASGAAGAGSAILIERVKQ